VGIVVMERGFMECVHNVSEEMRKSVCCIMVAQ
jgi:hypothetical protein